MAENETLDIYYRSSGRWRNAMKLIAAGVADERVAEDMVRNLYRTMQNLIKGGLLPLEALCAAATGQRDDIEELVRQSISKDYALLFMRNSFQNLDAKQVVQNVLFQTTDRFLDQIEHALIGKERFPNIPAFRRMRDEVTRLMQPGVEQLTDAVVASPSRPPRMPSLTIEQRQQEFTALLGMSILGH